MNDASMSAAFEAFEGHRTVVVRWTPAAASRAQVLFIPAFGDEMNLTRRMVRLTAEALVRRQIASTVFDPIGTGDSSAGFEEASVERWLADCAAMVECMLRRSPAPVILFGCRLGVALAVELTRRLPISPLALIGWAPVWQGRAQLSALLRADKIARGCRPEDERTDAKADWLQGRIAYLAGYPISPLLAGELEGLDGRITPRVPAATLLDVRPPLSSGTVSASESLLTLARSWREQELDVEVLVVEGAPFWNVPDLVDVPALVDASVEAIVRHVAAQVA